jgi:hypothetical protein
MGNEQKRVAERNVGVFFSPGGFGDSGILTPMNSLTVGPGEPGPGDEWHMPPDPADAGDGPTTEPMGSTEAEPPRRDR